MTDFWKHSARSSERTEAPRRGLRRRAICAVLPLCLLACSGLQRKVERRQGDHVELGRSISPRAYAWYARARYLHQLGELELAREAYRSVLADDPRSGAAYAGLGSTYCATDRELASATFARGLRRADERVPIYLARGHCELAWKQPQSALESARQAFSRAPSSEEVSFLMAQALEASGHPASAVHVRRGQRLYSRAHASDPPSEATTSAVDEALARGELGRAEALSLESMTRSTLATRAFALGHHAFAEELAVLVLAAAPEDAAAQAVLLMTRGGSIDVAADALPGSLSSCLWAEHLRRQVGQAAFFAFLNAASGIEPAQTLQSWENDGDPLVSACAKRLDEGSPGLSRRGAVAAEHPTSARL